MRKCICRHRLNEVAGNGGVVQSCRQMLHVHVFLAAPLGACHVAKSGADQHQGGVAVRERPHHAGPPADLPVQPLDHVVGADARPVPAGKSAVGQRFLCTILGHSLLSPFRMVCGNFILPEPACYVFFYAIFNLRNLLYIIFPHAAGAVSGDRNRTEIGKPRRKTGGAFGLLRKERDRISISAAGRISRAALPRARGRTRCVCGVRGSARGCAYAAPCTCGSPRQPRTGTDRRRRGSCP